MATPVVDLDCCNADEQRRAALLCLAVALFPASPPDVLLRVARYLRTGKIGGA